MSVMTDVRGAREPRVRELAREAVALMLFSAAVSVAIVLNARKVGKTSTGVALGLILGGALGNLIDRISGGIGLDGPVTDFIDMRWWPVFNLADSAIVIGAILLVVTGFGGPEAAPGTSSERDD